MSRVRGYDNGAFKGKVQAGGSTIIVPSGGSAFGGVTPVSNIGTAETDFINRDFPANFWNATGVSLSAEVVVLCLLGGGGKQLRGYVGGSLAYDSTAFSTAANVALFMEFQIMRTGSTSLAVTLRVVGDTPADVTPCTLMVTTVDFTLPINLRLTGQAGASNTIQYHHGYSQYRPAPAFLVL